MKSFTAGWLVRWGCCPLLVLSLIYEIEGEFNLSITKAPNLSSSSPAFILRNINRKLIILPIQPSAPSKPLRGCRHLSVEYHTSAARRGRPYFLRNASIHGRPFTKVTVDKIMNAYLISEQNLWRTAPSANTRCNCNARCKV